MPAETHSHRVRLGVADVEQIVLERLAEILGRDQDDLRPEARLAADLDAEEYALIELFDALEEDLGERTVSLRLDDEDLAELETVADVVECVVSRVVPDAHR